MKPRLFVVRPNARPTYYDFLTAVDMDCMELVRVINKHPRRGRLVLQTPEAGMVIMPTRDLLEVES